MAARLQAMGHSAYSGVTKKVRKKAIWTGQIHLNEEALSVPLHWRAPRKVFVNSMSDLFQDGVPSTFISKVWDVMRATPHHTYQVLTKSPENMLRVVTDSKLPILPNVWLGTSVESSRYKGRISYLRKVPAAVRFISFEPLVRAIGEIDLTDIHWAIVGGESGPDARPMEKAWVEEIQAQCKKARVAFFFKQWGGKNKKAAGRILRGRTWDEFPPTQIAAE
jgi:protein gp37